LIKHHDVNSFLDVPPVDSDVILDDSPISESPGTTIDRYKLLEKIGEGGMAVVYMAEQEKPIRRKVALKIIKLGMDTRQVIARFEAERQALAMMDHPNIAKVLDAGATETGRPYFVMELVKGVSITEYCDGSELSTPARLDLFLQVCNAVQHAHQKGIIHRDIKPSNVMVTQRDGTPVPKVIDFGIAKATSRRLTEKTLFTRYAHIIGTPAYMSPEQAELSELDIDTRSDIYSLGVLLYELLTGATPFSEEELREAGYIEMQRLIREEEPAKPSTKLSTLGETLTDVARHRRSTPDLLRKAIRGDLDWIVMKSLEKDRVRRYETANGLAMDIQRHLEHEPVLARGPSTTYRVQKFLQRHRSQTVAALATAVAVGAVTVILSMWSRDRLRLTEAEGLRHGSILSQAREQFTKADGETALETIKPILESEHVGPEARLLYAGILVEDRRYDDAVARLEDLVSERPEIAGAAHSLWARALWESQSLDAEKLKQVDEHRQKAQELLPETAEAYFLRAMTALTIKEKLEMLDAALDLDPGHYESCRLRAFTYYASRKYDRLLDDARAMIVLRPLDSLGYSLRAIAWHQLGQYEEAVEDCDSAIGLTVEEDPQYVDLNAQRCDTLMAMCQYDRVIADARQCLGVVADAVPLEFRVFCALTALGNYEQAGSLFKRVTDSNPVARGKLRNWSRKYVFDTLEAGRAWYPPGSKPEGVAFLAMLEADETYHQLSAKARRVVTDAFTGHWSPDGTKLAFSTGFHGRSGVAVWDAETGQADLLIVPGKDPDWSPDGRYIVFVHDRHALPLSELASAEPGDPPSASQDEEVWIMKADGTEPRRLTSGHWPCWSRDPNHIYFHSRTDNMLCQMSIEDSEAKPQTVLKCADPLPEISPDGKYVACAEGLSLKVFELESGLLSTELKFPCRPRGKTWSSDSRELCFGAKKFLDIPSGLWVYSLDEKQTRKVLDGSVFPISLALDGTKLLFNLHAPYFEIWVANLDPNVGIVDSLGPGLTLEEHLHEKLALYTQRIEADPENPDNYYLRAQCHDYLGDRASANADMRRWSAVAGGGQPSDLPFAPRRDFRNVVSLPFDYELVFSAERPVNTISIMSFAFGQKGRCKMKLFKIPMFVTSLFGLGLLSGLDAPPVYADFVYGEPTNLGPPVNTSYGDLAPCISADGLSLYFQTNRAGGSGGHDLWVTTRDTTDDEWGPPRNLGPTVNTSSQDTHPRISADGLSLYFTSTRAGGWGNYDVWMTTRETTDDDWGEPENLGPTVNSPADEGCASISADGLELYIGGWQVARPGGYGDADLWVTTRATTEDDWGPPENLGDTVNGGDDDGFPFISADGLKLYFNSTRAGGYGGLDIWVTTRATKDADWGPPVNLGPTINSTFHAFNHSLSANGSTLYFSSDRPGGSGRNDVWQASVIPIVDFNGDSKVDRLDMGLLMLNWGTDNSLCDIGPTPWGDGIVDSKDLMVLAEHGAILAGDVNYDGVVDFRDLAELVKNWLRQQP
jgi:serine/threonine protein kinase/Tol biopolymer transport system component/tetratricopeptide (TPR) repeat protein